MLDISKRIEIVKKQIKHCDEVIKRLDNSCEQCKKDHIELKESLELLLDYLRNEK